MAKAAILNVLEETIGRYVLGLDAKSLNVAVWAGKIELNTLQLDVEAVNRELGRQALEAPNLALPFRIVEGSFASLRVDVPWARITSKPVVLRASGLNATFEPYDHLSTNTNTDNNKDRDREKDSTYGGTPSKKKEKARVQVHTNETIKDRRQKDERLLSLQMAEEGRQRMIAMKNLADIETEEDDDHDDYSEDLSQSGGMSSNSISSSSRRKKAKRDSAATNAGFKARLVRRIIENLQLEIEDIQFSIRGKGCTAGIEVDRFSIFTTDKDGNKSFIDRATNSKNVEKSFLYKSLQLEGLAVYCDEDHGTPSYLKQPYKPMDVERYGKTYILNPLSFRAKLRQSDCLKCIDFPKYLLSAELPTVSFSLTRTQRELIDQITNEIREKKHVIRPLFPEYRPDVPIKKGTAKLWWRYAVRSIGRITRRRSWTEFYIAYRKRMKYIPLYKRLTYHATSSWLEPLTIKEIADLDRLERDKSISAGGIMSWRTISDSQYDLELKKYEEMALSKKSSRATPKKKSALGSLLFGRRQSVDENSLVDDKDSESVETPLIELTVEEMRELDSIAMQSASEDNALSSDSILCDVSFVMGSFAVDLITFASAPLLSLEMGAVQAGFKANVDGSFQSSFSLSSLNVHDRITPHTLFPVVIRSLQSSSSEDSSYETFKDAIELKLTKTKSGDQELEAKLVSYEIVGCDVLLKELKKFATISNDKSNVVAPSNPILQYSVSGGADLFYDAESKFGASTIFIDPARMSDADLDVPAFTPRQTIANNRAKVSDKLASAFQDAWKNKLADETVWKVKLNLHAPILVLPKSCTDPLATTIVVDLGTFQMVYGKELSPEVKGWFCMNGESIEDIKVDHCSIEMQHFSFKLAKAGQQDWLASRSSPSATSNALESIIEPVTLKLNIGVENGGNERKCIMGVMEKISVSISHLQIINMVSLVSTWTDTLASLSNNGEEEKGIEILEEELSGDVKVENSRSLFVDTTLPPLNEEEVEDRAPNLILDSELMALFHFSVALQKLHLKIVNDRNENVEAHLISAIASSTRYSDESSCLHLQMGHFWLLDHLTSDFPRRQRLLAHSRLPMEASHYSDNNDGKILEDWENSTGEDVEQALADIKITKTNWRKCLDKMRNPYDLHQTDIPTTIIDAKFSTLYIHWNPYSIRNLFAFQRDLMTLTDKVKSIPVGNPSQQDAIAPQSILTTTNTGSLFILNAELEAFDVFLNSAKDDLPLFQMTMSRAIVNLSMYNADSENMVANVSLGDFRLEVPQNSRIRSEYRTLLGLSPSFTSSLLQLTYGKGPMALKCCEVANFDREQSEMFIVVKLSPMRFVHIQSQVLTLTEYITEGVLGAMAQRVASNAAQAANEEALGNKVFFVYAQGFDFVLPQAAYSEQHFELQMGSMDVKFTGFPTPGHSEVNIDLQSVTMKCYQSGSIIEDPIVISVLVKLAPLSSPTPDEAAMRISVDLSRAVFVLTRKHYGQMMKTLDLNIGEMNSFLREDEEAIFLGEQKKGSASQSAVKRLTHGGVEEIIIKKRIYMDIKFAGICLELYNNHADPLVTVAAFESQVLLRLMPDIDTMEANATMLDLIVEDKRHLSAQRPFRNIVQQLNVGADHDVFQVAYSKVNSQNMMKVDLNVGSPQVTIIPDAMSDLLTFFERDSPPTTVEIDAPKDSLEGIQIIGDEKEGSLKSIEFKMKTDDCTFVLVDMGARGSEVTETVVMKGQTEVSAELVSYLDTGSLKKSHFELHGDNFQIYAAEGVNLASPVQIMNPVKFSSFLSKKMTGAKAFVDFAFVTLSDVDVTLSMRHYALFMAIASSTKDALSRQLDIDDETVSSSDVLTPSEAARIHKLASQLDHTDEEASGVEVVMGHQSTVASQSSRTSKRSGGQQVIKIKLTFPRACLTVVNDLQGVDEALFRVSVSSYINNTELGLPEKKANLIFHSHTFMLIHADYFDSHKNRWENLLLRPWEIDFKAVRGKKKNTSRMATTLDIESHPCEISFSEQFIISLKGAQTMWAIYSGTNRKAMTLIEKIEENTSLDRRSISLRKSRASYAARSLTTTLPYGVANRTGLPVFFSTDGEGREVENDSTSYFRFPLFDGEGVGGCRLYGQDAKSNKSVTITVTDQNIVFKHIDNEISKGKRVHRLEDGLVIFTEAKKTGKATILHVSSFMDIHNETCLDLSLSLRVNDAVDDLGISCSSSIFSKKLQARRHSAKAELFGVNSALLHEAYHHQAGKTSVWLLMSPTNQRHLTGDLELPPFTAFRQMAHSSKPIKTVDIVCRSSDNDAVKERVTISLSCRVTLIDGHPLVEMFLRPRLILTNNTFVNLKASTPMRDTYSKDSENGDHGTQVHTLGPFDTIECYHAGESVAFSFKCADNPIGGNKTGWNKHGWIDIPLGPKARLKETIQSSFPFSNTSGIDPRLVGGCDFMLHEEDRSNAVNDSSSDDDSSPKNCMQEIPPARVIVLAVNNIGVDHTGDVLFESWNTAQNIAIGDLSKNPGNMDFVFSSFSSSHHKRRVTLLPGSENYVRLLHLSMDGEEGVRRTLPFCIEDVPFCEGGIESSPVYWENETESGYYAYRKFSSLNQSELHIIPEFVIFNGGQSKVRITIQRCSDFSIESGKMSTAMKSNRDVGLAIAVTFDDDGEHKCSSAPVQVDQIGLKVVMVRSSKTGAPVGSLAIQTILGAKDSRFVVKLGNLKHGHGQVTEPSLFQNDFLHFRIRWTQFELTFLDTSITSDSNTSMMNFDEDYKKVAHFVLTRFTLDYQKLFKEGAIADAARSQVSAIINSINVSDCTTSPPTSFIHSVSENNFLDFRVRTRGSGEGGLAKVDLLELKIAHGDKKVHPVIVNTNEAFLWSLLDVASRTKTATSEFALVDTTVECDEDSEAFIVNAVDINFDVDDDLDEDGKYRAPRSDMIFAVKKMHVWPSAFLLSFKRQPQTARYQQVKNVKSAKIVNYFTKKLNFTISKAQLRFASFTLNNAKGPPDRILQSVQVFYVGQMKKKLFTLLTATSIDEWKQLAGRDDGESNYVEGDILRMSGNLTGKAAGYLVKKVGQGLSHSLTVSTSEVGNSIQSVSEAIGVGAVGAGVNSVVSGIGEGVGSTVEGVGIGGSSIIKGAGKGVGQLVGGVGGGIQQVAVGIGKGVVTGDGNAVLTGLGDGVTSIGNGVLKGTESVVTGTAEGVVSVGKGLFSGIRSLGAGVGNAVIGKPKNQKPPRGGDSGRGNFKSPPSRSRRNI